MSGLQCIVDTDIQVMAIMEGIIEVIIPHLLHIDHHQEPGHQEPDHQDLHIL
jgi:hypothetical protein